MRAIRLLIVLGSLGVLRCYAHTTPPVHCANIANCPDDPTQLPPLTDSKVDGGQKDGR